MTANVLMKPPIIMCNSIGSSKTNQALKRVKIGTKNIKELVFWLPSLPLAIKKIVVATVCPKTAR